MKRHLPNASAIFHASSPALARQVFGGFVGPQLMNCRSSFSFSNISVSYAARAAPPG
ncbi:hypothetical protein [Paracoccus mutanolyticus]|uniref:hypothetical protein n=1 Tax=Paracoccus mutanolyticus TaxID=1499308 RepID=UPI001679D64D|nr:hypothetical protein [Paracoccus mutanolyticus]